MNHSLKKGRWKTYKGFWWSFAFPDWEEAVEYANCKAQAVHRRQKIFFNVYSKTWWVVEA